jgi:hypothetical protein
MNGGKMREFLGKLDPRPQTIGLFVSHSGLDNGAWSVVRRAVNSKTVVVFERADIEAVLVHHEDIGAIFNRKLRDAYDYLEVIAAIPSTARPSEETEISSPMSEVRWTATPHVRHARKLAGSLMGRSG